MPQLVEDRAESPQNLSGIPRSSLFVSSLVVIALMSGWGIFLYLGIGSLIPTKPKPKPTPIHRNSKSATQISGTENETSASAYRDAERTFVLKLQRDEMQERLESTRASLAQARNVAHQFHTRMDTLQTSETGRRLATPNAARKMKLLTGFPERLDIAPFDSEMSQAERLMQSTDQPLSNFGQLLQQLIESSEFARLARQLKEVNDSYEEQVAPIRQAQATQLAAVDRQNRERADELRRILDSIEHIEREALAQITRRERAQAYAQDRSEIARLLQPFITPGTTQLREHWNDWKTTADRKPLSYQDLERVGALATDINGLRTYARIGGMRVHMSPKTARPLGGFPADYDNTLSNPTLLATVKRAQQLIKRHSVYLIEAGLLQP